MQEDGRGENRMERIWNSNLNTKLTSEGVYSRNEGGMSEIAEKWTDRWTDEEKMEWKGC
jgi:hypothetical protein